MLSLPVRANYTVPPPPKQDDAHTPMRFSLSGVDTLTDNIANNISSHETKHRKQQLSCSCRTVNYIAQVHLQNVLNCSLRLFLLLALAMPVISNFPRNGKLIEKEEETRDVNYCVLGTPSPDVAWYKAVDGKRELITKCSGTTNTCLPINNKDIEVKLHSFVIKNASYVRHHNVTYICRAENVKGQDEKNFTVFVESKYIL